MGKSCCFLILAASMAAAQAPARVGVGAVERKLTLADALEKALEANLDLEIERSQVATAHQAVNAARGVFDGVFRWQPSLESRNTPTSSILLGADGRLKERFHTQDFSYLQKLPWRGANFNFAFDNIRQSTTNPFVGLNPFITSRLLAGFQLPLMRNRIIDRERAEILIRSKDAEVSEAELELRVIDVVVRTELAYWDLVAARQDVGVKADGVEWAREQLGRNQRMIESGALAPVELAAAEAELERRLDTYYASLVTLTELENALKLLISMGREEPIWTEALVPAEDRALDFTAPEELEPVIATALARRPELGQLQTRRQANDIRKQLAQDQLKPQMNLVAGYANSGLAGTELATSNPFSDSTRQMITRLNELSARQGLAPLAPPTFGSIPGSLIGGYGSALSGLFGGNYQTFQVGLSLDWNTRNRTAEANLSQTVIAERRLKLERDRLEQAIAAQVRNALQAIRTAGQRIVAAEASARAAREKLDSETRLFQNGESTNFLVLTRQNEYSDSRRRVVVSRLDFNKAVARIRQATGTTLESHRLRVR